jgi:putative ABC transport system permease protein
MRIVKQLLTESVVLGLIGGIAGLAIGWAGLQLFLSLGPSLTTAPVTIDTRVLGFTLLLSIATGIVFGTVPALQVTRGDLTDALKENSRSATSTRARQRLRGLFVIAQIAIAFVLLTGAGLTLKTINELNNVQVGFEPRNLMMFQIQFARGKYYNVSNQALPNGALALEVSPQMNLAAEQIRARIASVPGVETATATAIPPLAGGFAQFGFTIEGRQPAASDSEALRANWNAVFPGYFETLHVPLVRGRTITEQDSAAGSPIVVISESMARSYWPNEDPIGKRITSNFFGDPPREIIGIVGDVRQNLRQEELLPAMYVPYVQMPTFRQLQTDVTFVVRAAAPPPRFAEALRAAAAEIDRTQAIGALQTVEQLAAQQNGETRLYATLLSVFGFIAVLLAIVGIYGIMAHSVAQRTSEVGVRVALGAGPMDIMTEILRRGVLLIAIGLFIGVGAALALTRIIRSVLWGVTPTDPLTFTVALLTLAVVALLASYVPARRALRVDPVVALRQE